jgi:hypothetical protein
MRKFLLYCLSVDYRYTGYYELPASEHEKYIEVRTIMADIRDLHNRTDITEHERCVLASYFWKHLHKPCKRLAIPVDCAVRAIARLAKYPNGMNRYTGCTHGVLHNAGTEVLANKLWQDRNILIPQLATRSHRSFDDFRAPILRVTIDGVNNAISRDSDGSWDQDSEHSCSLTARGSWEILGSCVQDLSQRRGIFPAGKKAHDRRAIWSGPEPLTSGHATDEGARSHLRGWFWYSECRLPDFFEHRPGRDRCDL